MSSQDIKTLFIHCTINIATIFLRSSRAPARLSCELCNVLCGSPLELQHHLSTVKHRVCEERLFSDDLQLDLSREELSKLELKTWTLLYLTRQNYFISFILSFIYVIKTLPNIRWFSKLLLCYLFILWFYIMLKLFFINIRIRSWKCHS